MRRFYTFTTLLLMGVVTILPMKAAEKNKGELANIVCFVRFVGEDNSDAFELSATTYNQMFNDETQGANSVYNYFYEASYGQLQWKSTLFPLPEGDVVMSYSAKNERTYYKEKSSIAPNGYEDEVDRAAREQALVKEIASYLSANLPDDAVIDANNDGIVDNMCIVLSGRSEISNRHLLWPH
ncbi:MAG: peptidase M6, partial [Muribaculaceae bacterium]|nr:peptidase M6 [Muribaculaceae bacterium]